MYRYSDRLPWSFSLNRLHEAIQSRRAADVPLLDLTVSNPTEALLGYPHGAISLAYANIRDFTYRADPLGLLSVRQSLAAYYASRSVSVSADDILLTASTSEAYSLLFKLFCDPGDEVLVPVPSYPLFEYLAALESVRCVSYPLTYDGRWFIDFAQLIESISAKTKAIVIVNPNNPTGSFLKNSEFDQLVRLALHHHLPIISDEVFMDYAINPASHQVRSVAGDHRTLSFALNGFSKMAGMPQVKLGWITVSGPAAERAVAKQRLELILDAYLSVNSPVQAAFDELLKIGFEFAKRIKSRVVSNSAALTTELADGPAHALHTEAGWSAIIQAPAVLSEDDWTMRLLEERGVVVQPGYFFDMTKGAYLVVSLITPEEPFRLGLRAIDEIARGL